MIRFYFEEDKAIEAAALLLNNAPQKRLNVVNLMKMLYLADRESIKRWNHPIIGDQFRNMKYGPVLLKVTNLLQEDKPNSRKRWYKHIQRRKTDAVLVSPPKFAALSRAEMQLLQEIWSQFGSLSFAEIVDYAHKLPEYESTKSGLRDLPPEAVFRAVGKEPDAIAAAENESIDPHAAAKLRKIYATA